MKLPKQFITEIKQFERIYCLVSGGYHSTASALLLKDHGFENVILVHNRTYLESSSSKETMKKLQKLTKYSYIETKPDLNGETVWDVMKRSFQKIPEVIEDIKNNRYDRKKFECCTKLKKNSSDKFFAGEENFVVIDSSCPYESNRRSYYAMDLRNRNTYLRLLKKRKFWKTYPFRDVFSEKDFLPYLKNKGFHKIKHSGCVICPILICFKMYNERYYNTLRAMARAGMPCFQKIITDFMEVSRG